VELAAILTRAMAQNPDERYATAAEFRDALRQIGRVDEVECVARHSEIDSAVVEIEETAIIRSARVGSTRKLGSHAVAAMFVILLAAFGVFCSYYPWKIPPTAVEQSIETNGVSATRSKALPARSAKVERRSNHVRSRS
jgi:hypothetical protein